MSGSAESMVGDRSFNSTQYYKDIIYSLPNFVYILDKNCIVTDINRNLLNLFGMDKAVDVLGVPPYKKLLTLAGWEIERVESLKHDDISALVSGEARLNVEEMPVRDKEGNLIYYRSSRMPIFDDKQKVIGLVCILEDISKQKELYEQFDKIKEQLQKENAKEERPIVAHSYHPELAETKRPPRVLMVEDNSTAQKAAQALLMQLDCYVDIAESGDKAAMLFEPGKYDLVFMDIGLEDTSGYVVSKKIRQLEKGTLFHVPIIALTGYEADIVKYDCDDYSMEGALTKPLTTEQAKQIIQHYIYHIDIPIRGLKTIKSRMD